MKKYNRVSTYNKNTEVTWWLSGAEMRDVRDRLCRDLTCMKWCTQQRSELMSFEECEVSKRCGTVYSICEQCLLTLCRGPQALSGVSSCTSCTICKCWTLSRPIASRAGYQLSGHLLVCIIHLHNRFYVRLSCILNFYLFFFSFD